MSEQEYDQLFLRLALLTSMLYYWLLLQQKSFKSKKHKLNMRVRSFHIIDNFISELRGNVNKFKFL